MNKLSIVLLTSVFALGNGLALAESGTGNGLDNATAKEGAVAPTAKENLEPKNIDNSKINTNGQQRSSTEEKDKQDHGAHGNTHSTHNADSQDSDSKSH